MLKGTLKSLTLVLTERCNLKCQYCYLAAGHDGLDMTEVIADQALAYAAPACHIQLTGGEPTLVPDLLKTVVTKVRAHSEHHRISLQTNATCLTEDLVQWLRAEQIQVGVSLDGPAAIQDKLRGNYNGTIKGLALLKGASVPFNVTCVVSNANVLHLDQLALLLAAFPNCHGLGLDLLVHKGRTMVCDLRSATSAELTAGITKLAQTIALVNRSRRPPLRLRELDLVTKGGKEHFCHAACGTSLAVTAGGELYPCSQSIGLQELQLGTLAAPEFSQQPLRSYQLAGPHCEGCLLEGNCPGECPNRIYVNQESARQICTLYQSLAAFSRRTS